MATGRVNVGGGNTLQGIFMEKGFNYSAMRDFSIDGEYIYMLDHSDPSKLIKANIEDMSIVSEISLPETCYKLVVIGDYIYVNSSIPSIKKYNKSTLSLVTSKNTGADSYGNSGLLVHNNRLFALSLVSSKNKLIEINTTTLNIIKSSPDMYGSLNYINTFIKEGYFYGEGADGKFHKINLDTLASVANENISNSYTKAILGDKLYVSHNQGRWYITLYNLSDLSYVDTTTPITEVPAFIINGTFALNNKLLLFRTVAGYPLRIDRYNVDTNLIEYQSIIYDRGFVISKFVEINGIAIILTSNAQILKISNFE